MKNILILLSLLCISHVLAQNQTIIDWSKWLVGSKANAVLVSMDSELEGYPFGTVEDYVTDKFGIPYFLISHRSHSGQNLDQNLKSTVSITANNCSQSNWDGIPYDQLACWRIDITGEFETLLETVTEKDNDIPIVAHFFAKHPAAPYWISGSQHQFKMVYLNNIKNIFYAGGYGNIHYIGPIDPIKYLIAEPIKPDWL